MDIFLGILSILCLVTALIGCVFPAVPGPPIAYLGLLLLHMTDQVQFTTSQLIVWAIIVLIITLLDSFIPMLGTKYSKGTKWGSRGSFVGTIVGMFFLPWGIILGPFLGALIGELLGNQSVEQALRSGIGSLIGFLLGTFLKLVLCLYFLYEFFAAIW